MLTAALSIAIGLLIGLSLGALGGGGSILTVPALVYVVGLPVSQATGTSLAIVGANAALGVVPHFRSGRVNLRLALGFGAASAIGAVGGSLLGRLVPGEALLSLFALLMLAAGALMLQTRPKLAVAAPAGSRALVARATLVGAGVGILTGFFGVGGGFLIVPALVLVLGQPMHVAVGTSLVIITIASVAGLLAHLEAGAVNLVSAGLFFAGGVVGTQVGARFMSILPERRLRRLFALLIFALAAYLLVRNLPAALAHLFGEE